MPAIIYTELSFYDAAETKPKGYSSPQFTQHNYKLEQK